MKGYDVTTNGFGFRAIRLHYSSDPQKDPLTESGQKWLDAQRRQWPDPNSFQREFEISFFAGQGARVFPQFTTHFHCPSGLALLSHRVIYRAWDFGFHAPTCLFAQVDGKDRLVLIHELVGNQQTTYDFAKWVVAKSAEWFPNHAAGFEDFCDPAGQQVKSIESERNERRDTEILSGLGIYAKYQWGWSRKDGRSLIHQLLNLRSDGTPSLFVDEAGCPLLAQSFLGRYVYPEHQDGTISDEPDEKTHPWADLIAALRYLAIGLHPRLGVARFQMARATPFVDMTQGTHGYGTKRR